MDKHSLQDIISRFKGMKALIVGDVMIDAYIWGKHTRMSPEAPVPVVDVLKREARLGGAGNVARNIKSVGAIPILVTAVGEQGRSDEMRSLIEEEGMDDSGIFMIPERVCTVKTRVISNDRHMLRVDEEQSDEISSAQGEELFSRFSHLLETLSPDVVIIQDYDKGVMTEEFIAKVIHAANTHNVPVTVDPKKRNFMSYKNCSLFKPNLKEMQEGLDTTIEEINHDNLDQVHAMLQSAMPHQRCMITLSEHGVYWNDGEESQVIPAFERKIIDVSGAGDTVIAIASLAIAAGADMNSAATLSNLAGGLVCEEVGVQPIEVERLMKESESISIGQE